MFVLWCVCLVDENEIIAHFDRVCSAQFDRAFNTQQAEQVLVYSDGDSAVWHLRRAAGHESAMHERRGFISDKLPLPAFTSGVLVVLLLKQVLTENTFERGQRTPSYKRKHSSPEVS